MLEAGGRDIRPISSHLQMATQFDERQAGCPTDRRLSKNP